MTPERLPVEDLRPGDEVQAYVAGPVGRVLKHRHKWAEVEYPNVAYPRIYRHERDHLTLIHRPTKSSLDELARLSEELPGGYR